MKQPELVNIRQNHNNNAVPPTPTATDKWRPLTKHLRGTTPHLLSLWGALFGFLSFFSMMAFTKSFVAFTWREEGDWVPGIDYKTAISVFQMFSYTISKWVGIKIVPGIARRGPARFYYLLANGAIAFLGLILFGFLPPKFRVIGPVLTGIPLGLQWGITVSFLEGRQTSDFMLGFASSSFMLLSGIIKDAAIAVRAWSAVPLEWRPLVVSSFFFFPYIISVFMLCQMPSPSRSDVECRVVRRAMQKKDRQDYLYEFWPGLVFANIAYFFTCAYRHYRDLYSMEIFMDGNEPPLPGMFTRSGLSVGVGVTIVMCSLGLFKSNYYGFMANIFVIIFGYILCAVGMIIYDHLQFQVSPMALMILTGIASFSAYIPYGSTLYERKIAYLLQLESVTSPLSAVFPIQLGGGVGSLGTLIVLLVKNFTNDSHWNHLQFFRYFSYLLSVVGTVSTMMMAVYFVRIKPRQFRKREQEYRDYVVDKVNSFYH